MCLVFRVEKPNSVLSSDCGKSGRRSLVYPREKWDLSEMTDLIRGESGWEAHGVRKSPAWTYSG